MGGCRWGTGSCPPPSPGGAPRTNAYTAVTSARTSRRCVRPPPSAASSCRRRAASRLEIQCLVRTEVHDDLPIRQQPRSSVAVLERVPRPAAPLISHPDAAALEQYVHHVSEARAREAQLRCAELELLHREAAAPEARQRHHEVVDLRRVEVAVELIAKLWEEVPVRVGADRALDLWFRQPRRLGVVREALHRFQQLKDIPREVSGVIEEIAPHRPIVDARRQELVEHLGVAAERSTRPEVDELHQTRSVGIGRIVEPVEHHRAVLTDLVLVRARQPVEEVSPTQDHDLERLALARERGIDPRGLGHQRRKDARLEVRLRENLIESVDEDDVPAARGEGQDRVAQYLCDAEQLDVLGLEASLARHLRELRDHRPDRSLRRLEDQLLEVDDREQTASAQRRTELAKLPARRRTSGFLALQRVDQREQEKPRPRGWITTLGIRWGSCEAVELDI